MKIRRYLFLLLLVCSFSSCDRFPDPSTELLENYSFWFGNSSGIRFLAGEPFNETIKYNAINSDNTKQDFVRIIFDIVAGGGTLSRNMSFTDQYGTAITEWQLGSDSFKQILKASAFNNSGKYLTSTTLNAYGFREDQWDTLTDETESYMTGMVADTVNNLTFMITNGKIFRQGVSYYDWEEVVDQDLVSPRTLEIDRNGVIYASTWQGEVLKSTDHGESWKTCTKPYPDNPYYIYMYVSNDNWIWVFKFDYPTIYSKDGGLTWITAGSELSLYGFGDVFRCKNGSLLFHGSNCCSLNRSDDDGATWTPIETPGYSVKAYVNDNDEIFICTQENGISIYQSKDMGATFQLVHNVYPMFGTSMDNTFTKWNNFYYILIPGYGILKSDDLVHYETYWINNELNNLFIDHNGVLIAKDGTMNTVYYRKNTE